MDITGPFGAFMIGFQSAMCYSEFLLKHPAEDFRRPPVRLLQFVFILVVLAFEPPSQLPSRLPYSEFQ